MLKFGASLGEENTVGSLKAFEGAVTPGYRMGDQHAADILSIRRRTSSSL